MSGLIHNDSDLSSISGSDSESIDAKSVSSISEDYEVAKHFDKQDVCNELQDIIGGFIGEEKNSMDLIQNNAKLIGGVIGAEYEYLKKHSNDTGCTHEDSFYS